MKKNKEKIIFQIPQSNIDAKFTKYKNDNWKFTLINISTKETKCIAASISKEIVTKLIKMLIGNPRNQMAKNDFNFNVKLFKQKVARHKQSKH